VHRSQTLLTCLHVISSQCPRRPVVSPELQSEGLNGHSVCRTGSLTRISSRICHLSLCWPIWKEYPRRIFVRRWS
jgi:hypothetical protein